jgi:RNA polymerase sigma factor (sigma-70 family)
MSDIGSITLWLQNLCAGDRDAVAQLWNAYFAKLVRVARRKLDLLPGAAADEEDVALSAFKSFCIRAEAGAFPDVTDRDGLWALLVVLTRRKAANLLKFETQAKRDWRRVQGPPSPTEGIEQELRDIISQEPEPSEVAQMMEEMGNLLDGLGDQQLRMIALGKLDGFTNEQIAAQIGRSVATVERRLELIRVRWATRRPSLA